MANVLSMRYGEASIKEAMGHGDGGCDHVEAGTAEAVAVGCEDDSFGPVARFAVCQECIDKDREETDNALRTCRDCKNTVKRKEGSTWTWYDFYAAQGDEPIFICNTCWDAPTHKNRMANDRIEEREETEHLNNGLY